MCRTPKHSKETATERLPCPTPDADDARAKHAHCYEVDMRHPNDVHFWVKADDGSDIDESFAFLELVCNFGSEGNLLYKQWDAVPPYYRASMAAKAAEFCDTPSEELTKLYQKYCAQRGECLACAVLKQKLAGGTVVLGSVGVRFKNNEILWHHGNGRNKCDEVYAREAPHGFFAANLDAWERYMEMMYATASW